MADKNSIKNAENAIRDLKNLIFVLAKEHGLPTSALDEIHKKIDEVAVTVGNIK